MSDVLDRFLRYVRFDTQSNEQSSTQPSTETQWLLLRALEGELREIGLSEVALDANGYLTATIPATTTRSGVPTIGFISHVDTSPEMPGANVKPIVHRALRRPRPGAARRSDRGAPPQRQSRTSPRRWARTSSPRPERRCSAPTTKPASPKSSRQPHVLVRHPEIPHGTVRIALYAGRRGRPRRESLRRPAIRRRLRLHHGRRRASARSRPRASPPTR